MVPELLIAALICGWALKGRYQRLLDAKIKYVWMIFIPLGLMVATRVLNYTHVIPFSSPFHGIVRVIELLVICVFAGANIRIPGAKLLLVGLIANTIVVAANGGAMPVSYDCILAAWGKRQVAEYMVTYPFVKQMLIHPGTRLVWLCDIIPVRRPFVLFPGVYSVGDLISSLGGMIAIISLMRTPLPSERKTALEEQ